MSATFYLLNISFNSRGVTAVVGIYSTERRDILRV